MNRKFQLLAGAAVLAGTAAWLAWPGRESAVNDRAEAPPASAQTARHGSQQPSFLLRATAADWRGETTRAALSAVLCQCAELEPAKALPVLDSIPEDAREAVQQEVAAALISTQPLEAVQLLAALPQSELNDRMLRQAAMEYATREPDKALPWASSQPETGTRALLLSAVLCARAATDPASAAAAAVEQIPAGAARNHLVAEIVQRWAQSDASAAQRWLDSLPDGCVTVAAAVPVVLPDDPAKPDGAPASVPQ